MCPYVSVHKMPDSSDPIRCDEYRRSLPDPAKYRPWVRDFFDGVPSAAGGKYTPAAASIRAGMESGKQVSTQSNAAVAPVMSRDLF